MTAFCPKISLVAGNAYGKSRANPSFVKIISAMIKNCLLLALLFVASMAHGQQWIDTLYQYRDTTLTYGSAVDFGGNLRDLEMDISIPTNDTPPPSGRPAMLLIHGGAFMAGTKQDPGIVAMRKDFAKRGYVTAAIDYRLGMFQTASSVHCNISYFLAWDCLNQTDTLEWTRAYYRGIQDARGAIRWLVNHAATFNIDPQNIFVVGESAGAFIAMGTGFLDDNSELPAGVTALPDAAAPNSIYEGPCVQTYGLDSSIASLDLARPDLGDFDGTMNYPAATSYRIKGVGDLYGGVFDDLFAVNADDAAIPCLYIFHQPADLIVPYGRQRLFAPYAYCCTQFPWNCVYIINRPFVSGGSEIKTMIDAHAVQGDSIPDYLAEFTTNNASCNDQISNASVGGHQLDNYWTRTYNMAVFFAPKIVVGATAAHGLMGLQVYPNPSHGQFRVVLDRGVRLQGIAVHDLMGKVILEGPVVGHECNVQLPASLAHGTYLLRVSTDHGTAERRIMVE
jgi:acetyl esterase/lipase